MRDLRATGAPAGAVRDAFAGRLGTRRLLALHLAALDHERAHHARAAAVLRGALGRDDVGAAEVMRRLDALDRAAALERDERVAPALRGEASPALTTSAVEAAFRDLPEDLADAQWDAVIELVDLLADRTLALRLGEDATQLFDLADDSREAAPWRRLLDDLIAQAHGAWVRHDPPTARRGRVLATRFVSHAASLARVSMHAAATDLLARADRQDPRIERVWALIAIIRSWSGPPPHIAALRWLIEAVRAHRPQFRR
jgi:hypothetical protein